MNELFDANKFAPTQFDLAEDKAMFTRQFIKFVQSDFKKSQFPAWFYKRLSMTFGHIAHYNQAGFYETFFTTPKGKVDFIGACLNGGGYGDPAFTYSDVERHLKDWLVRNDVLEKYRRKFQVAVEDIERAWAAAAKYRNRTGRRLGRTRGVENGQWIS